MILSAPLQTIIILLSGVLTTTDIRFLSLLNSNTFRSLYFKTSPVNNLSMIRLSSSSLSRKANPRCLVPFTRANSSGKRRCKLELALLLYSSLPKLLCDRCPSIQWSDERLCTMDSSRLLCDPILYHLQSWRLSHQGDIREEQDSTCRKKHLQRKTFRTPLHFGWACQFCLKKCSESFRALRSGYSTEPSQSYPYSSHRAICLLVWNRPKQT